MLYYKKCKWQKHCQKFVKHSIFVFIVTESKTSSYLVVSVWSKSCQPYITCNTMPSNFSRWQRQSTFKIPCDSVKDLGKVWVCIKILLVIFSGHLLILTAKQLKTTKSHVMVSRKLQICSSFTSKYCKDIHQTRRDFLLFLRDSKLSERWHGEQVKKLEVEVREFL
jgi:hypothetical protein